MLGRPRGLCRPPFGRAAPPRRRNRSDRTLSRSRCRRRRTQGSRRRSVDLTKGRSPSGAQHRHRGARGCVGPVGLSSRIPPPQRRLRRNMAGAKPVRRLLARQAARDGDQQQQCGETSCKRLLLQLRLWAERSRALQAGHAGRNGSNEGGTSPRCPQEKLVPERMEKAHQPLCQPRRRYHQARHARA